MKKKHFITVDWCSDGNRGIFCDKNGKSFHQKEPYTKQEMAKILGAFYLILNPESLAFTEEEINRYNEWTPLAEYNNFFGIARK